ncbi:unknown [Porphyromonas sp. CAG:1061]|nr:unknown [Porphyromonas sp. CAG:1061]
MKRRAMRQLQSDLRQDGTTERAKAEARELLHKMFGIVPGTVIVLDTPAALPPTAQPIPLDQPTLNIQKQDEIQ